MSHDFITAYDISLALSQGRNELEISENAVLTAQAKDHAERMGLTLRVGSPVQDAAKQSGAQPQGGGKSAPPSPLPSLPFLRSGQEPHNCGQTSSTSPEQSPQSADLHNMVREAVIEALRISSTAQASALQPVSPQHNCASCGACSGKTGPGQAQAEMNGGLKYSMAGRVKSVDAGSLPWEVFPGKTDGQVNIVDVVTPSDGSPMGGGYLEWNKASFAWRLTYAEIDVILEGELHISSGGKTVVGRPGDMLFIPQDTDVVFSSPGYVKFAYATWPADWSSLVAPQDRES